MKTEGLHVSLTDSSFYLTITFSGFLGLCTSAQTTPDAKKDKQCFPQELTATLWKTYC